MKKVATAAKFLGLLILLFLCGFTWRDIRQGRLPSSTTLSSLVDVALAQNRPSPEQEFLQNYTRIQKDYYKPVDSVKLTYASMEGLMASLGDPHTMFMPPQIASDFNLQTNGTFVGIGCRLSHNPMGAKAESVFENGPAYHAGLRAGDLITGVNSVSVVGKAIDDIVAKIRGEEGTEVKLKVLRGEKSAPLLLTVRRARVETPTVSETKVIPGTHFGYFQVATFSEPTTHQFDEEIAKLEKQHINGLIIDLRDNPGGLLDTAKDMLSRFVENKLVVTVRYREGREEPVMTDSGELHDFNYPVVLLVNEDSASAAEIFSGALQDYKRATLVGTHTYGKASVQNVIRVVSDTDESASAKVTIAHYFLPRGPSQDIGRKVDEEGQFISGGLKPDVEADMDPDTSLKGPTFGVLPGDTQLEKAVEVLKQKTSG
jgi:carboxyl-terminal processing protease